MAQTTSKASCRLLYVVGQLHTGGLERQLYYLLRAMDRERHRPAIAVWNHSEIDVHVAPLRELGVPIHPLPAAVGGLQKLRAFRRLVANLEPEVIHSYTFYTNFAAYYGSLGTGAVPVGSVRSDLAWAMKESGPLLGRLSAALPTWQIVNSRSALAAVEHSRTMFAPRHAHVVRNGLDLERFRCVEPPPDAEVGILGIGYLLPVKRWERLLTAAATLKNTGLRFQVRIAGDGPLKESLEQVAHALDLDDCVHFLSHTDDIPRLLAASSFVVHTADNEGCPNAVMEAMACGRPVVATDAGDVRYLVEDGLSGFVVPVQDQRMLVDRMETLMRNPQLRRRMGKVARAKAEQGFGLERLVDETLAVYRRAGWNEP